MIVTSELVSERRVLRRKRLQVCGNFADERTGRLAWFVGERRPAPVLVADELDQGRATGNVFLHSDVGGEWVRGWNIVSTSVAWTGYLHDLPPHP